MNVALFTYYGLGDTLIVLDVLNSLNSQGNEFHVLSAKLSSDMINRYLPANIIVHKINTSSFYSLYKSLKEFKQKHSNINVYKESPDPNASSNKWKLALKLNGIKFNTSIKRNIESAYDKELNSLKSYLKIESNITLWNGELPKNIKKIGIFNSKGNFDERKLIPSNTINKIADELDKKGIEVHAFGNISDLLPEQSFVKQYRNINFPDLCKRFEDMDCFIGNDTGLAHLAHFLKKKSVLLFGSTSGKTYCPPGSVYLSKELPCSPCYGILNKCPFQVKCMADYNISEIFSKLNIQ